ncbi:SDR family NAD(P)-dependent oxidoreductase [Streptomyces coeruleorubidus]|uniref:SDR family oxidoreductase n=1 Tax=Streptomyces coeruleorubidus TaxID=116188 RepID=A0ABZ0KLL4_STRC4|nr:SDR family NAD(P)-dependent oxidoreductase [Streptomyces coeruleorubidus]WOT38920.1 SDR family oxidoreductase [Streptomyces coeruleorubidus]
MQVSVPDVSSRSLAELISLSGRRAVVTGAGRGLGRAIARRLAEAGADVLVADIESELAVTAAEGLNALRPGCAVAAHMDVSDAGSVIAAADLAVRELGGLDIWVNNAGIFPSVPALEMSDTAWDEVFAVNTRGVFLGSREAARRMREPGGGGEAGGGGVIVNVVSTAGFRGTAPGLAAYVGSKHAARGITRQLALEFAPFGIRVLGVAPTYVPTEGNMAAATAVAGDPAAAGDIVSVMRPSRLGRLGVPDDIARVVLFCASDLSAFMTGSTLLTDAGETI